MLQKILILDAAAQHSGSLICHHFWRDQKRRYEGIKKEDAITTKTEYKAS